MIEIKKKNDLIINQNMVVNEICSPITSQTMKLTDISSNP